RKLADFSSGVLVANLGHNPTRWWQRVIDYMGLDSLKQADEFVEAIPLTAYNAVTELDVVASERLVANLRGQPGGGRMEQVFWSASGSEAIQKSLWAALARRPGEDIMLATRIGFHGKKGLAGATTGSEKDSERDPRVCFITFPSDECIDVQRRRQPIDLAPYEAELTALSNEFGSRICCLLTEPYLGGGGSFHPQPEYLQLLERFCREHDILFILDEIQSNFGRTGPMYAFTHYGIEPDIVCLGKGLGNGVPVSAAVGPADVFAPLKYGEGSDTWSANPLSSAAVLATLDEFESTDVIQRGQQLSKVIEEGLIRLKENSVIVNVRGEGCVWGLECAGVGSHSAEQVANECVTACYLGDAEGRAIHLLGPLAGRVLRVSPPLVMPLDEAREYFDVMYNIFSDLGQRLSA
ncbi:MAG: aminotransferase class III-fold pyridoxal phosphate-dependent enzyme, partial [Planctomycetes bacterium]|nr:aminotransferase class III-fold pyridoxal phosphate-dependent enzyme [Planctomycetota bacterium]